MTRAYGVDYDQWELHEGVPKRAIVIVDDTRPIRYTWGTEDAYHSPDLDEVSAALNDIRDVGIYS